MRYDQKLLSQAKHNLVLVLTVLVIDAKSSKKIKELTDILDRKVDC